ncbi:MAG: ABC transporter substrate-binding protein [Microbacterium sp.]|uniref:ABC transporter substrate-binding protein n=1 Tax=Microbacterium sp. TaxID=51671 RepID=UPI003F7E4F24
MKRSYRSTAGIAVVATLALAGCSGGGDAAVPEESSGPLTLTMSGWNLDTAPEFQTLADAYHEKNPDVTIELKGYDAAEYNTLVTADLAAGSAPDIITQKEIKYVPTFVSGGQLLDVSDVKLSDDISGAKSYEVDGTAYAVPYRGDSWVLYYNKALFDQAGVDYPDGAWTWDDYADAADALAEGLTAAGSPAKAAYLHVWPSPIQGFANAQTDGDILTGDFEFMKPFYERQLALQAAGDQVDYNTATANQLTYQGEFGKQNAAMMIMGTWYTSTLIAQQASGDANTFDWGIAPAPQVSSKTAGLDKTPVTFGAPAGLGINAAIDESKVAAAKDFLAFAAGEEGAQALAAIGVTPALLTDPVVETYFSVDGAPSDDLSKFAFSTHELRLEYPVTDKTAAIQGILGDMHTAIMSGSQSPADAIKEAQDRVANEVGTD